MTDTKKTKIQLLTWYCTDCGKPEKKCQCRQKDSPSEPKSTPVTDTKKTEAIMQDRSQDYGDASINWASQTKIIQAMVEQAIQMKLPVDLPPQFAAWVMVTVKGLRDVYKSKEDNYLDAVNYVKIAEKTK